MSLAFCAKMQKNKYTYKWIIGVPADRKSLTIYIF